MIEPHNLVDTAQALVDITKDYLMEIQSNDDWSLKSEEYTSIQLKLVDNFKKLDSNLLQGEEKERVRELLRICYQLELQINHEVSRQQAIVSQQISQFRKGNDFKGKYEMSSYGSGIIFDAYK